VLAFAPFGIGRITGAMRPPEVLRERFPTRSGRVGIYILDENGNDLFAATAGLFNQLVIACGSWPVLVPILGPRTPPVPLESVERHLGTFATVVAAAIASYYPEESIPQLDVTLEPTGTNVEAALAGLRRLGRTAATGAAGHLSNLRDRPPGRVHADDEPGGEVSFEDVGGQDAARDELEAICLALREPERYRQWAVRPPRGVLLYGPPGTGKTLLARCLAREAGARFIHVRASDVTSKWYGEAERRLQQAFDWARREAPAVIFFDEIDAIARSREDAHEATHRVVATMLENMDGLQEVQGVLVLAATNRPEAVDAALTRPGRFDRLVEVPLPSSQGRRAIFGVHIKAAERKAGRSLFVPLQEPDWKLVLDASEGFSGADAAEAVRRCLEAKARAGAIEGTIQPAELLAEVRGVARPW
jgi:hypothetical protein